MSKKSQAGFTLIEALITLVVLAVVLGGLYALLDSSNKLAKQETHVAEAQQSLRIGVSELARVIRQGRVGGLFVGNAILPIENNSAGGVSLTDLSGIQHYIRKGTDVIEVRGILSDDKYALTTGDVTCGGSCATTTAMSVTIRATSSNGVKNFTAGQTPAIAGRTRPFYFVVADSSTEVVTTGSGTYLVPVYYTGLVDTTGTWFTQTATTFSFSMDPQDAGARKLLATPPSSATVDKPFTGGVVERVVFFVDEGDTDASTSNLDTHPSLAEAAFDPASGNYEIQPLIEEVEDFQIAFGVDGIDGTVHDRGISPASIDLTGSNRDEWVGNVANEISSTLPLTASEPRRVEAFLDSSSPSGPSAPVAVIAALRSVMMALVVKSTDPDFVYDGPGGRGIKVLDSTARSFSTATGRPYRRRLQTFAVSLRNYQ